jgi:hypothetical protein
VVFNVVNDDDGRDEGQGLLLAQSIGAQLIEVMGIPRADREHSQ